jgi:hypothetical protein
MRYALSPWLSREHVEIEEVAAVSAVLNNNMNYK